MARIRTVKPELWTDGDYGDLTPFARLLFIAILNFASDYGVLADKPRTIKAQCLPFDDVDAGALIEELVSAHFLLREMAPDSAPVLVVRTFNEHQKVNRPNAGRWGNPAEWSDSVRNHGVLSESSPPEGKGREGKGKESRLSSHVTETGDPQAPVDNVISELAERFTERTA